MLKRCSKCSELKEVTEYHKNKRRGDGVGYMCKTCCSEKYFASKKENVQLPWRQQKSGYPYKGLNDPEYIKSRDEVFAKNGNGWWWGWTKENTPIPGIYAPHKSKKNRK